jgi:hypothetical protein
MQILILKKILFIFLFVFIGLYMKAQNIIGRIIDDKNSPIEFANVAFINAIDSTYFQGTVSKADGTFDLSKSIENNCFLKISCVGYKTVYKTCTTTNVGSITLFPESTLLKGAVITALRPTFKLKNGALVTDVKNSLLSKAGTANDVLSQLPSVEGKDGKFTVFGKGTPLIYLNGRLLHNMNELSELSSADIKDVEVLTNPGSQYDASVKAVIKIYTVRKVGDGWGGSLMSSYYQSHKSRFTEDVSINYRKGGLDFFSTLYYNNGFMRQSQTTHRTIFSENGEWTENSNTVIMGHNKYMDGSIGMNYVINNNHSLGFTYDINRNPYSSWNNTHYIYYSGKQYDGKIDSHGTDKTPDGTNHEISAYYDGKIGKLNINYNGDYIFSKRCRSQYINENSDVYGNREINSSNDSKNRMIASKLILSYPVGKGNISAGSEYTHINRTSSYENQQHILNSSDDNIKEKNIAGFVDYNCSYGKFNFDFGARYEYVVSDYYENGIFQNGESRKYHNIFPNASIAYGGDKIQSQLSYTCKVNRPAYYALSDFVQYDDRFMYEGGNPALRPSIIHDLSWQSAYSSWLQLSLGYQYIKDAILSDDKFYDNSDSIILFTSRNVNKLQNLSAMITISPKVGFWQPRYSISMNKEILDNNALGVKENLDNPMFLYQMYNSFSFPDDFMLNINVLYWTSGFQNAYEIKGQGGVDISMYKGFLNDRLTLKMGVDDIFKNGKADSGTYYGEHTNFVKDNYSDSRRFMLTMSYRFNSSRSKYKGTGAGDEEKKRF